MASVYFIRGRMINAFFVYSYIHADVSRNIMTTSMNERTHFFVKIYL